MLRQPKCHQCNRQVREDGFLVCLRPGDVEEWLCGRSKCEDAYNDDVPPKKRKRA